MLKIYTDAAFDNQSCLGYYCLVICDGDSKDWYLKEIDKGCISSNEAEYCGIVEALQVAAINDEPAIIYCDNKNAIARAYEQRLPDAVVIKFIKAHTISTPGVELTEDLKRQHWADVMAFHALRRRLDSQKTVAYNEGAKET